MFISAATLTQAARDNRLVYCCVSVFVGGYDTLDPRYRRPWFRSIDQTFTMGYNQFTQHESIAR